MPHSQRVAEFLLSVGAVKLSPREPYTWTSGMKAPIYCDNRMLYSHPVARSFIVQALTDRVRNLHIPPDVIAGTATAAIGWAALVADKLDMPFVYVRSKAKEHGTKKLIEGDLKPEKHVVVVEDLLSTGGSAASTVETLRSEGKAIVTDVVAIFSYEFLSAREKAAELSVHFHPLSTITTLLTVAVETDRLSEEEAKMVAEFVEDPEVWGKR